MSRREKQAPMWNSSAGRTKKWPRCNIECAKAELIDGVDATTNFTERVDICVQTCVQQQDSKAQDDAKVVCMSTRRWFFLRNFRHHNTAETCCSSCSNDPPLHAHKLQKFSAETRIRKLIYIYIANLKNVKSNFANRKHELRVDIAGWCSSLPLLVQTLHVNIAEIRCLHVHVASSKSSEIIA